MYWFNVYDVVCTGARIQGSSKVIGHIQAESFGAAERAAIGEHGAAIYICRGPRFAIGQRWDCPKKDEWLV